MHHNIMKALESMKWYDSKSNPYINVQPELCVVSYDNELWLFNIIETSYCQQKDKTTVYIFTDPGLWSQSRSRRRCRFQEAPLRQIF